MPSLVLDTHSLIWYTTADPRLSLTARDARYAATQSGDLIYIPPICIVECIYLVEKRRIPATGLEAILVALASLNSSLTLAALALRLPLVSRDRKIRVSGIETLW